MSRMSKFLIAVLVWALFPAILYYVSQQVSLIGIYHKSDKEHRNGEPFFEKFLKISKCNIFLSIPIITTLYLIIAYSPTNLEPKNSFFLSLPISIVVLSTARVLSNPSKLTRPSLCKFCDVYGGLDTIVKLHKERIISFNYSLICTTMILMLILFSYSILFDLPLKITGITPYQASEAVLAYFVILEIVTFVIELLLSKYLPPLFRIDPNGN